MPPSALILGAACRMAIRDARARFGASRHAGLSPMLAMLADGRDIARATPPHYSAFSAERREPPPLRASGAPGRRRASR